MVFYIIGIGLNDEKDITEKGLEIVRKANKVYLEIYTSKLNCSKEDLEKLYGKEIREVKREEVETHTEILVNEGKDNDVAFLVIGSPFVATTHTEFLLLGKKLGIEIRVIENASVYSAIGITGLFLYKFGRTTTIPFDNKNIRSPYEYYLQNKKLGMHTLVLLDIKDGKLMTVREGLDYLIRLGLDPGTMVVACGALGSLDPEIKYGKATGLNITKLPQCFIIPGELHFKELEVLDSYL